MTEPKKILDPEFKDWQYYQNSRSGFWIYYAPEDLRAAMVDPASLEVLFIMDRSSGEELYRHPEVKKFARIAAVNRILESGVMPRKF